jgi:hypothetical protein
MLVKKVSILKIHETYEKFEKAKKHKIFTFVGLTISPSHNALPTWGSIFKMAKVPDPVSFIITWVNDLWNMQIDETLKNLNSHIYFNGIFAKTFKCD